MSRPKSKKQYYQKEQEELLILIEKNTEPQIMESLRLLSDLSEEVPQFDVEISFEGAGNADATTH